MTSAHYFVGSIACMIALATFCMYLTNKIEHQTIDQHKKQSKKVIFKNKVVSIYDKANFNIIPMFVEPI